ncbi:MAG: GNAT family N-acetyltransferase [Acidimicrobiia bacterium]|nr:GNAT family N-acetyltransferase [Acidimicrobiia bacterium]
MRHAAFDELSPATLYEILRLRTDVFVVEQRCAYPELDGRDLEHAARHWWIEEDAVPVAYLRVLTEADGTTRIGRVVTAPASRGRGLAAHLLHAALTDAPRPVVIHAQAHLERWYRRFGFVISGPVFDEDGIDHLPMRID